MGTSDSSSRAIIEQELKDMFAVIPKKNHATISTAFERVLDKLTRAR